MKTVTGKILSSTPISVSKAANIIANFSLVDNGSSQAVSAYLRRASASFNELKQLHREIRKSSKSSRKDKQSKSENTVEGAGESSVELSLFNLTGDGYGEVKKYKKRKNQEKSEVDGEGKNVIGDGENKKQENGLNVEDGKIINEEKSEGEKKKKKKRKNTEMEEHTENNSESKKKKKKKTKKGGDN